MSYAKVETSVRTHRKFIKAGPAASWLWLCGVLYCQDVLTDGFIAEETLEFLGVKQARRFVAALEQSKLWDRIEGGWQIHDYLEHNKPAAEIDDIRRRRADGGKYGGRPSRKTLKVSQFKTLAEPSPQNELNPSTATATATATNTETVNARAHGSSIVRPRRKDAAWEGGRVYVPQRLHADFIALRNTPDAERDLLTWYAEVDEDWAHGAHKHDEPGGELFVFWRQRYAEKWPTKALRVDKWEAFAHDKG